MKYIFSGIVLLAILGFSGCGSDSEDSLSSINNDSVKIVMYQRSMDIYWSNVDKATKYLVGIYPYSKSTAKIDSPNCSEYDRICTEYYTDTNNLMNSFK